MASKRNFGLQEALELLILDGSDIETHILVNESNHSGEEDVNFVPDNDFETDNLWHNNNKEAETSASDFSDRERVDLFDVRTKIDSDRCDSDSERDHMDLMSLDLDDEEQDW